MNENDFDSFAEYYNLLFPEGWKKASKKIADRIDHILKNWKNPIYSILDCGCGTGIPAIHLASKGYKLVGIDISNEMLNIARRNSQYNENLKLIELNWNDLNTLEEEFRFDAIICRGSTINFCKSQKEFHKLIDSFRSIIRNGGILYIQTLNCEDIIRNKIKFSIITEKEPISVNKNKIIIFYIYHYNKNFQGKIQCYRVFIIHGIEKIEVKLFPCTILPFMRSKLLNIIQKAGFKATYISSVGGTINSKEERLELTFEAI